MNAIWIKSNNNLTIEPTVNKYRVYLHILAHCSTMNWHDCAVDLVVDPMGFAAIQIWKTNHVSIVTENIRNKNGKKNKRNNIRNDMDGDKRVRTQNWHTASVSGRSNVFVNGWWAALNCFFLLFFLAGHKKCEAPSNYSMIRRCLMKVRENIANADNPRQMVRWTWSRQFRLCVWRGKNIVVVGTIVLVPE